MPDSVCEPYVDRDRNLDEAIAALVAIPLILTAILMLVTVIEGTDRRQQLHTVAHRGAVAAAAGIHTNAPPPEVRAAVAAGTAAARDASTVCADRPTVAVDYFDQRTGDWLDPARYDGNTDWTGTTPDLSTVRVSVECWLLPGPLPAMTRQVTQTSQIPLAAAPPAVAEAPETDPEVGQLQEER